MLTRQRPSIKVWLNPMQRMSEAPGATSSILVMLVALSRVASVMTAVLVVTVALILAMLMIWRRVASVMTAMLVVATTLILAMLATLRVPT